MIDEVYGPGFRYRTPLSPCGAYLCLSHPGPYPDYFLRERGHSHEGLAREAEKHLPEPQSPGPQHVTVKQVGLGESNMRAALLTHVSVRVYRANLHQKVPLVHT